MTLIEKLEQATECDGIMCPVCRGSGHVVGEDDRVRCPRCHGDGAFKVISALKAREHQ